jgi:hypothetical protein
MFRTKCRSKLRSVIHYSFVLSIIAIFSLPSITNLLAQNVIHQKSAKSSVVLANASGRAVSQTPPQQPDARDQITGIPWTGEAGVQENVVQIMARHLAEKTQVRDAGVVEELLSPDRSRLQQNPNSPATSQFPAPQKNDASLGEPLNPQTLGTSFTGATLGGANPTNAIRPDTMGAAGPTQFIVAVNGRIVSFNKATGAADGILNTTTDNFFTSVRNSSVTQYPRIRFDRLANRWIMLISTIATPNRILLAVSDTATITASSVWTFFFFQQDQAPPTGDATCRADYPTLGIDANALYIGVNQFCGSPLSFGNSAVFVVRKSSVLGAGPIVVTAFRNLILAPPNGPGMFAPQGVDNFDPAATEGYFIGVDNSSFGTLIIRRVSTPGGTPTLSGDLNLTVPATALPFTVRHQGNTGGTNGQLSAIDDRLMTAVIRNGRLWTVHNLAVDNTGSAAGTRTRDGARWYEISSLDTTPALVQSGTLFASNATNTVDDRNYWMPSLMVSGQGHMALGSSIAGTNEFIKAASAGRLASDPLGTLQAATVLTSSSTAYNPPGDPGTTGARSWGSYSYTSLDPCDDMSLWTIQQFCDATNSYGLRVVKLLAPPPATPLSASPAAVAAGQASVNITITGSQVAGSAFFDPGAGFGCHIGASVSSGVIVNSVTYQSPTTVVLNISTVAASGGPKDITIINPDGQTKTGASILTVTGVPTCSYSIAPTNQSFPASGGTGSVTVTTTAGCGWSAASNDSWITVTSGASGTGNGSVNYSVAGNGSSSPRTGTVVIAGQTFTVTQAANLTTGTQTIGLYRPTGSLFFLRNANSTGFPDLTIPYGALGDLPVVGDWDGNGTVTIGVYRPSTSTFYLRNSNTVGLPDLTIAFGDGPNGDLPIVGDWDGNGTWTIGVYRPSTSTFYLRNSNTVGLPDLSIPFGASGDKPVIGDWDGNGTMTIGLYRSSTSTFYLRNSNTVGLPDLTIAFGDGPGGDLPLVGDWDGNGTVTIGVYRPSTSTFYLRNSNTAGFPDLSIPFGTSGDKPLAGNWDGQ